VLVTALVDRAALPKESYLVRGKAGVVRGSFAQLSRAVAAASDGDAIEFQWNGGLAVPPVSLPRKILTLRPAAGFTPAWIIRGTSGPAISGSASLTLSGIRFDLASSANATNNPEFSGSFERPPPPGARVASPGNPRLLRWASGSLTLADCVVRRTGLDLGAESSLNLIQLDGCRECSIRDCAFLVGGGTGIDVSGGFEAMVISNTAAWFQQCFWVRANPGSNATIRLERSTFKGECVFRLAEASPHTIIVSAKANLFNTAHMFVEGRREAGRLWWTWFGWEDYGNLYCLAGPPGPTRRYFRLESNPGLGPQWLQGWRQNWRRSESRSVEAQAEFNTQRVPGASSGRSLPDCADFELVRVLPLVPEGTPPKLESPPQFGAILATWTRTATAMSGPGPR
jgi:hypothetical protein